MYPKLKEHWYSRQLSSSKQYGNRWLVAEKEPVPSSRAIYTRSSELTSLMLAVSYSVSSSVHATGLSESKRMQNTMKYVSACQKHSLNSYSDINTTSTAAVPFSSRYERTADVNCTSVLQHKTTGLDILLQAPSTPHLSLHQCEFDTHKFQK